MENISNFWSSHKKMLQQQNEFILNPKQIIKHSEIIINNNEITDYKFIDIDFNDKDFMETFVKFINENHKFDNTIKFNYLYENDFITNMLTQNKNNMNICLIGQTDNKIYGFINGSVCNMQIYDKQEIMVDVKILIILESVKQLNLSPLLMNKLIKNMYDKGFSMGTFLTNYIKNNIKNSCEIIDHYIIKN